MKRRLFFAMFISIMILLLMLWACSDKAETQTGGSETSSGIESPSGETEPADSLEARKSVADDLPVYDFQGAEYKIICEDDKVTEYDVEELNGDVVNDVVYNRNSQIEERFNAKINIVFHGQYDIVGPQITKVVLAGEPAYDLISHHVVNAGKIALQKIFMNWHDVPYINFEKPWWPASTINDLTYNNVTILAVGDVSLSSIGRTYCVFYDKVKAENHQMGNLYETVHKGEWTIDKLSKLTMDIYEDMNGDGNRDFNDFYGFATGTSSNLGAYLWAFDNPVMKKDSSGTPVLSVKTPKMNNIVEKLVQVCYVNPGTYVDSKYKSNIDNIDGGHVTGRDMFYYGNTIFANGYIDMAIDVFRSVENDYGIIPYPKWDEAQKKYISLVDGNFAALAIPKSAGNLELSGIITEALCAESYKSVVPAYYDVAMKVKFVRDVESVEILDLLMAARMFDFGYIYDGWEGCSFYLEGLVRDNNTNFESYYAKNESKVIAHYNKVIELFESYMQ